MIQGNYYLTKYYYDMFVGKIIPCIFTTAFLLRLYGKSL